MGSVKDSWIDDQNENGRQKLAEYLGVTKDELDDYASDVQDQTGNDDVVYRYYIEFKEDTPEDVINRVKGIDDNRTVYFDLGEMDRIYGIDKDEE